MIRTRIVSANTLADKHDDVTNIAISVVTRIRPKTLYQQIKNCLVLMSKVTFSFSCMLDSMKHADNK